MTKGRIHSSDQEKGGRGEEGREWGGREIGRKGGIEGVVTKRREGGGEGGREVGREGGREEGRREGG